MGVPEFSLRRIPVENAFNKAQVRVLREAHKVKDIVFQLFALHYKANLHFFLLKIMFKNKAWK